MQNLGALESVVRVRKNFQYFFLITLASSVILLGLISFSSVIVAYARYNSGNMNVGGVAGAGIVGAGLFLGIGIPILRYVLRLGKNSRVEFYQNALIYYGAKKKDVRVVPHGDISTISEFWNMKQGTVYRVWWSGRVIVLAQGLYGRELRELLEDIRDIE